MKNTTIIFLVMLATTCLQAQSYYIDFTAGGTATTLDSVYVYNLTQDNSLILSGNDTLHLLGATDVFSHPDKEDGIKVYPNPLNETGYIEFFSDVQETAEMSVFDMTGRMIFQTNHEIQRGLNIFEISGFSGGYYQLRIFAKGLQKTTGFVSMNTGVHNPQLRFQSHSFNESQLTSSAKNTRNTVQMSYNTGDEMLYIGYAGLLSEDIVDIPTSSQTVNFLFSSSSCGGSLTDIRDGKTYNTVRIGQQCWMAENLKYLPSVVNSITGSYTIPYYYVYGYEGSDVTLAEATTNYNIYGVLYNWIAAVDGSSAGSSTNPSGLQGICPTGWHLPSEDEFIQLTEFLGGGLVAGGKLKESGIVHWSTPNTGATNESGFTALPGGGRSHTTAGGFNGLNFSTSFWSSRGISDVAYVLSLSYSASFVEYLGVNKRGGKSVRCVKD
jgi:uncharacterized protein (TIGR02145 family)